MEQHQSQQPVEPWRTTLAKLGQQGLKRRAAAGLYRGPVPLGYRRVIVNGIPTAVADEKAQRIIADLRHFRSKGVSVRKLKRLAEARGLRSKRGKVLGISSIHYLVTAEAE